MSKTTLGIIGGGQLGSMLAIAAKKLNVETIIYCDDPDSPGQNFCNKFISGEYNDNEKIVKFVKFADSFFFNENFGIKLQLSYYQLFSILKCFLFYQHVLLELNYFE